MAIAKKCDRCGKFYEATKESTYQFNQVSQEAEMPNEEFPVNSIRIGYWDARKKEWRNIASAYDLCKDCAGKICDVIFNGDSQMVMRKKVNPKAGRYSWNKSEEKTDVEAEQVIFAQSQGDTDETE